MEISTGDILLEDQGEFIGQLRIVKVGTVCSDTGTFTLAGQGTSIVYDVHTLKSTSTDQGIKYYRVWKNAKSYIMAMLEIDADDYDDHLASSGISEDAFQIGVMLNVQLEDIGGAFIGEDITEKKAGELYYEMQEEVLGFNETGAYNVLSSYFDVAAWFSDVLLNEAVQEHNDCYFATY